MSLQIRFVTDFVCPYCVVAKKLLLRAIQEIKTEKNVEIDVLWHPMELTEEPAPKIDTYHDEERKEHWAKTLVPICEKLDIQMKLPPHVIPRPYTRLAWEGFYFAKEKGKGDEYSTRLYDAYFVDELDIGNLQILIKLIKELGLDEKEFQTALKTGKYSKIEKQEVQYAKEVLKVTSVPTIYIGKQKVDGAIYSNKELKRLIEEALKEDDPLRASIHGMSCDIHGCQ